MFKAITWLKCGWVELLFVKISFHLCLGVLLRCDCVRCFERYIQQNYVNNNTGYAYMFWQHCDVLCLCCRAVRAGTSRTTWRTRSLPAVLQPPCHEAGPCFEPTHPPCRDPSSPLVSSLPTYLSMIIPILLSLASLLSVVSLTLNFQSS